MSINDNNKLYNILDVSKKAGAIEIKKAYQKSILSAHPDHGGSNEKQVILNAWVAHRGSIPKVLKDLLFLLSTYNDRSDPERKRVETIPK